MLTASRPVKVRINSLKSRMALLMGLVLVVPAGYTAIQAISAYVDQSARLSATLQRTARLIATYQGGILDKSRTSLERIAQIPEAAGGERAACDPVLATELQQSNDFSTLAVSNADGVILCASSEDLVGSSVADRPWFADLQAGFRFVVSELTQPRESSAVRTIVIAVPMKLANGSGGSLSAGIRLVRFSAVPSTLELPEGAVAYLVDARGQLLAANTTAISPSLRTGAIATLLEAPGSPVVTEIAGEPRRLFVAEAVLGGRLFVVVGLPAPLWSWLERDLVIGIFAPTLMLMLAVMAIWTASDFLINRHIRALAAVARAYSRGALDVSPDIGHAPTELKELGDTMARMARRIQSREAELKASLDQKDVLLKEIHHRVKNNLQIVTSLLNLRARSIVSPAAQRAMHEAQMRIKALALVHRNLYEQDDVKHVELSGFLGELCELLREIAGDTGAPGRVDLALRAGRVQVSTDQAIPIALLVTEAVSNAFKHAFPDGRSGTIRVELERAGDGGRLVIADDGVGMTRRIADGRGEADRDVGIGLTLIEMLAKQIGGQLVISGQHGTQLELVFGAAGQIEAPPTREHIAA